MAAVYLQGICHYAPFLLLLLLAVAGACADQCRCCCCPSEAVAGLGRQHHQHHQHHSHLRTGALCGCGRGCCQDAGCVKRRGPQHRQRHECLSLLAKEERESLLPGTETSSSGAATHFCMLCTRSNSKEALSSSCSGSYRVCCAGLTCACWPLPFPQVVRR